MTGLRPTLLAACLLALLSAASPAAAQLSGLLPGRGFSVDGRRGALIDTVDPGRVDARIREVQSRALANESGNRGQDYDLRLPMPETEAHLANLIERLDSHWPHPRTVNPTLRLRASSQYGARALSDGSIIIDVGLIDSATSDDEVALVLGHELGHLRLGHFADDAGFRRTRQTITALGQIYTAAAYAEELRLVERANQYQVTLDDRQRIEAASLRAQRVSRAVEDLVSMFLEGAWSRNQEDEADAFGFDVVTRAGLNAADATENVFVRFQADYDLKTEMTRDATQMLSQTLREISAAQAQQQLTSNQAGAFWRQLERSGGEAVRNQALRWAHGYFSQRHRTPEARRTGLATYSDRAHPDMAVLAPDRQWLDAVRASEEFREAVLVASTFDEVNRLTRSGDFNGAVDAFRPLLQSRYRSTPAIANRAAEIYAAAGQFQEAVRFYEVAHQSDDQTVMAYKAHSELLLRHRRFSDATAVADRGVAFSAGTVDPEKLFLPVRVGIAFQQRRIDDGMPYLQRCVAYREPALADQCVSMALGQRADNEPPTLEERQKIDNARRQLEDRARIGFDFGAALRDLTN